MIALLQRVTQAAVTVDAHVIGQIGTGLMVLVCAERGDTPEKACSLAKKLMTYRVFADDAGKLNRSVLDVNGALLLVSQFTLAADTKSGTRPSFSPAAPPEEGRQLFELFVRTCQESGLEVQTGEFGAHMQVSLINDGPVTLTLRN